MVVGYGLEGAYIWRIFFADCLAVLGCLFDLYDVECFAGDVLCSFYSVTRWFGAVRCLFWAVWLCRGPTEFAFALHCGVDPWFRD